MNALEHFDKEVEFAGWNDVSNFDDKIGYEMQQTIIGNVRKCLELISKQGHSGFSIGYFKSLLNNAIDFKPIKPLTGEENEWNEVSDGVCQNKRCSRVFKDKDGSTYIISHYLFRDDENDTWWSGKESRKAIEFPYAVEEEVFITLNGRNRIKAIEEYEASKG